MATGRTVALVVAAAFVGSAIAGLPPVRDGLDRATERAGRAWRAPRRRDVVWGVRCFQDDRRVAASALPGGVEALIEARVRGLRARERVVYAEAARRDARRAFEAAVGHVAAACADPACPVHGLRAAR